MTEGKRAIRAPFNPPRDTFLCAVDVCTRFRLYILTPFARDGERPPLTNASVRNLRLYILSPSLSLSLSLSLSPNTALSREGRSSTNTRVLVYGHEHEPLPYLPSCLASLKQSVSKNAVTFVTQVLTVSISPIASGNVSSIAP